jgi:hypothetical protein
VLIPGVQPKILLPHVGCDLFDAAEILFANLAAVGIAEGGITFLRLGPEESMGEDGFKLTDAEFHAGDFAEKTRDLRRGKGLVERLADYAEGFLVLDGDGGLLEHLFQISLRG